MKRKFIFTLLLLLASITASAQSGAEYDPTLSQMFALPILTLASL